MTLAEFRKKHPNCKVGYPSPSFPLGAMIVCSAILVVLIRYLIHFDWSFESVHGKEHIAPFGAGFLCIGVGTAVYASAKRLGEVLDWVRKGRNTFALADEEGIVVNEAGESAVFPIASVVKLELHLNYVELKLDPKDPAANNLGRTLIGMFRPGDDGPTGASLFHALAPRVKKLAPNAEVTNRDADD